MKRRSFLQLLGITAAAPTAVLAAVRAKPAVRFGKVDTVRFIESPPMTPTEIMRNALRVMHKHAGMIGPENQILRTIK